MQLLKIKKNVIQNLFLLFCFVFVLLTQANEIDKLEKKLNSATKKEKVGILVKLIDKTVDVNAVKSRKYFNQAKNLVNSVKDPILKMDLYYSISLYCLVNHQNLEGLEHASKGLKISINLNEKKHELHFLIMTAELYGGLHKIEDSYKFYQESLKLNKTFNDLLKEGQLNYEIGNLYNDNLDFVKANIYFDKALKIFREIKNKEYEFATLREKATALHAQQYYAEALEGYLKTMNYYEKSNDIESACALYNDIGNLYSDIDNDDKALFYYKKAMEIAKKEQYKDLVGIIANNLGTCYLISNEYDKALEFFKFSLEKDKKLEDKAGIAIDYFNIGCVYYERFQLIKAEEYIQKSIEISSKIDDQKGIVLCNTVLAGIYRTHNKFKEALVYLNKANDLAKIIDSKELVLGIYEEYSYLYASTHDYKRSREYYEKADKIRNKIGNEKSSKHMAEVKVLFETERKEREIEKLKHEQIQNNLELNKQELYKNVIFAGLVVGLLFLILLFREYRLKVKSNEIIKEKNNELEKAYAQLEEIAATDHLTGLSNRRDILDKMSYEMNRFSRTGRGFTLIMGDIDDFKEINDNYGHDAGDFTLISISDILKECVRKQDIVCRWGGEEFLILLLETKLEGGVIVAENIRQKVFNHMIKFKDNEFSLSMTFGVCELKNGMNIDQCVKGADDALYEGKEKGKNLVISN